ncbi:MAG TPA: DUF423 domain-containing protein [Bacteroidia bacterium]|jgi:uncharacterized membrane protein YgdD (TMEM256/DUF423 family)
MQKRLIRFAGISGALGVALGAMAAHYLKSRMESGDISLNELQAFETASRYQIYHSITLLIIALMYDRFGTKYIAKGAYSFMAGIVLFSGSLYILSTAKLMGIESVRWLGPVTPIGGLFLIAGWLFTGFSALKSKPDKVSDK